MCRLFRKKRYRQLREKYDKLENDYYQLIYTNCIQSGRLERIKNIAMNGGEHALEWIIDITNENDD